jgi:hypothetical protein
MKSYCKYLSVLVFSSFICLQTMAQEKEKEAENTNRLHHRFSLVLAHSHIPSANEVNDQKVAFIAPTIGLNYELWFNNKWAVGLHNDFIVQAFNIETEYDKPVIQREYPILSTVVGIFKPGKHFSFFAGPGVEFEKNEDFKVIKTGIEYGVELPKSFEFSAGFEYDAKINGYGSWLVGFGISKNIFSHK